jgi:uncharacterized protein involved in outer membrane biogenesis
MGTPMKRSKKILLSVVLVVVVLGLTSIIVAGLHLGDIVKKGVETVGSSMTQVTIKLDEVHLSLLAGSASLKGLVVGNPQGYQTPQAISATTIAVGVNPLSVFSDKIVLRSIYLEAPEITFEGGLGGNNLSQIIANINATSKNGGPVATNAAAPAQSSKKFEVDDLLITHAKVNVNLTDLGGKKMTLDLPPIHLTNLGKNPEGITATDLSRNALKAILSATVKAISDDRKDLGKEAQILLQSSGKNSAPETSNLIQGIFKVLNK